MIENFLAEVRATGLARPNRYMVEIIFPQNLTSGPPTNYFKKLGIQPNDVVRVNLFCEATSLPSKSILATSARIYGPSFKMPYDEQFEDMAMNFYVGADMKEKKFFDAWQAMIVDPHTGDLNYHKEFVTKIKITQLDSADKEVYGIELYDAWPIQVNQMILGHAESDSVHILPVTFAFWKWEPVPIELATEVQSIAELLLNTGPISNKLQNKIYELKRKATSRIDGANNYFVSKLANIF